MAKPRHTGRKPVPTMRHKGLALLPEVLGRPVRHQPKRPLPTSYQMVLLAALVPPALVIPFLDWLTHGRFHLHEPVAHMLLESFCALIALVVFYVLRQEWKHYGGRRLALLAHGFLLYGIINLAHAWSPHHTNSFVFLHSIAGNVLALVSLASVIEETEGSSQPLLSSQRTQFTLAFATAGFVIILVGVAFAEYVPWRHGDGTFTLIANSVNISSAVLFSVAGVILINDYRRSGEPILFYFGLCMLAFAEVHALFPFSRLSDLAWWGWHVVKLFIFLGLLFGIAFEAEQTLQDQIEANAALQKALDALEERNRECSAAYDELAATQSSLVRSERLAALGQVAGMIAHEIRNPLGALTNCLGLLRRHSMSREEVARALGLAEEQVDRIEDIVATTLNAAREHGSQQQATPLLPIIDEVVSSAHLEMRGLVVTKDIFGHPPTILGSPQQLRQLVWNLLVNAAEAMPHQGQVRIVLETTERDVELTVEDDGPGIPAELRNRVFEPLFSTKVYGTGLGLAIVKQIAMNHGGMVEILERDRRGAAIQVRLPRNGYACTSNLQ